MTFTYLGTLATDLDIVRFQIGDTVASSGPKPNGGNFTDEEISGLITLTGSADAAITRIYQILANVWAMYVDTKIGPRDEKLSQVAARYATLATQWSQLTGIPVTAGSINLGIDEEDNTFDIT